MNALETRAVHAGRRDLAGLGVHVGSSLDRVDLR